MSSGSAMAQRISRTGKPGKFRYRLAGQIVSDKKVLERIEKLAVPPAWKQVQIATSPRSKVQAQGRDAAGRLQRIYHPAWRSARDCAKHDRLLEFGRQLPKLRRAVARNLRRRKFSRQKVVACVIRLIDREFFRVGNDRSAKEFGHYGITTLRRKHVGPTGQTILLEFIGKSGQHQQRQIRDPRWRCAPWCVRWPHGWETLRPYRARHTLILGFLSCSTTASLCHTSAKLREP